MKDETELWFSSLKASKTPSRVDQVHTKSCAKKDAMERAEKALNDLGDLHAGSDWQISSKDWP